MLRSNVCMKIKMISVVMLLLCVCVCVVAEGLSQPRSSADGWRNPDLSAAPAGRERAIPWHPAERAGQDGGARKTQPHAGSLLLLLLTTNHKRKIVRTACILLMS